MVEIMPLAPGDKLGPYEIRCAIGRGGMGEVYRAHDPRLKRDVAIKVSAERFSERFEREARAVAALNHPNICQIYDVGLNYLVMEFIEGPTLRDRIDAGAISFDDAMKISEQIAQALAAAHEKLITHRDLKPGNVIVKDDGTVKVLDFGLAKIGNSQSTVNVEDSSTLSISLTQKGLILGTAAYMSPEQARGKPVDARADIWAFGVVLFEMLTGKHLFQGNDLTETLANVVKESPDLETVPYRVRHLLGACLQKDPKNRLQAIADQHLLLADPEERPQSRVYLWPVLGGVAALIAFALAWDRFHEMPPASPTLRFQLTRPNGAEFAQFQLSPNGRFLAFVSADSGNRLFVRALDSLEEHDFPGTDGSTYPFWSPDSKHIAFFSQRKLKRVAVGGGPVTNITDAPDGRGGAWGPEDTIVYAPAVTGTLFRVSAAGGPATTMDLPRIGSNDRDSLRFPSFIPDSDRFLYTLEAATRDREGIYVGSLRGDSPVCIASELSTTRFVRSAGSKSKGFILFRRATTLMAQPFDAAKLKTTGEAFRLADQVPDSGNVANVAFTVSADGTLMYFSNIGAEIEHEVIWLDRSGQRGRSLLKQKGITDFALSPDHSQLMYSMSSQRIMGDLWLLDMARGAPQRFTFGPFNTFSSIWSPDNSEVVMTVFPEDRLYLKSTQSTAKEEPLPVTGSNSVATSWSADGSFIVYSQTSVATRDDIWLLPLGGDRKPELFKQTIFSENEGQISPDGHWMAYTSDASGQHEVYLEPKAAGGRQRQISVGGGKHPRWRADGLELYFLTDRKMMAVSMNPRIAANEELTVGTPQLLFDELYLYVSDDGRASYHPSIDGKEFLALIPASNGAPTIPPLNVVTNWQSAYEK